MFALTPRFPRRDDGDGGKKRPPASKLRPGHYDERPLVTDQELLESYNLVGVGRANNQQLCPRCLRRAELRHRQFWRECNRACPACPRASQHFGQVCPRMTELCPSESFWRTRLNMFPQTPGHDQQQRSESTTGKSSNIRNRRDPYPSYKNQSASYTPSLWNNPNQSSHQDSNDSMNASYTRSDPQYLGIGSNTGPPANSAPQASGQNPWTAEYLYSVMVHQMARLVDFFDRNPHMLNGEEVITPEMRVLLRQMRTLPGFYNGASSNNEESPEDQSKGKDKQ